MPSPMPWLRALVAVGLLTVPHPATAQVVEEAALDRGSGHSNGLHFGVTLALDGQTLAVAAPRELVGGQVLAGTVTVWQGAGGWAQEQVVTAAAPMSREQLGWALDLEGDLLVVGAPFRLDGGLGQPGYQLGMVHLFRRTGGSPPWTPEQQLQPAGLVEHDWFGRAVAVSGDVLAVSATGRDDGATRAGVVFVYRFDGATWQLEAELTDGTPTPEARFGQALALDGDTLAVGAPLDDGPAGASGTVSVFVHDGAGWQLQALLSAGAGARGDEFGAALSLDGDLLAVGAPRHDPAGLPEAGAVHLFSRSGALWSEGQTLVRTAAAPLDNLGHDVALSGDVLLAGVPDLDTAGGLAGGAVLFRRAGGLWSEADTLIGSSASAGDRGGWAVAVDGDLGALGAPDDWAFDDWLPGENTAGRAFVFSGLQGGAP